MLVYLNGDEDSTEYLSVACSQATPAPTSSNELSVYRIVGLNLESFNNTIQTDKDMKMIMNDM